MEQTKKWHKPLDPIGQSLETLLCLGDKFTIGHISRQHTGQWFVSVERPFEYWPKTANGVSLGGLWGDGYSNDLGEAARIAIKKLTANEAERETVILNAERERETRRKSVPSISLDDIGKL